MATGNATPLHGLDELADAMRHASGPMSARIVVSSRGLSGKGQFSQRGTDNTIRLYSGVWLYAAPPQMMQPFYACLGYHKAVTSPQ